MQKVLGDVRMCSADSNGALLALIITSIATASTG